MATLPSSGLVAGLCVSVPSLLLAQPLVNRLGREPDGPATESKMRNRVGSDQRIDPVSRQRQAPGNLGGSE
jgi:hypothetical protein